MMLLQKAVPLVALLAAVAPAAVAPPATQGTPAVRPSPTAPPDAPRPGARAPVDVRAYGAKGDGVTDDYEAIQAAVAQINAQGGGLLVFPKGTYRVARHRIDGGPQANGVRNFEFRHCDGLTIDGQGSKIDLDGDWIRAIDYTDGKFTRSYHNALGFNFVLCNDLEIRDLEIDGHAELTTKVASAEGLSHGISLEGCRDVTLDRIFVHHMQADGLIVTATWDPPGQQVNYRVTRNLKVSRSRFTHNARQGMSVIHGRHATFHDCDFSYTGQTGKYGGHSPQAGVDVEPGRYPGGQGYTGDDFVGDLVFSQCRFVENGGFEYVGTNERTTPHAITFYGSTFSDRPGAFRPAVSPGSAATRFLGCTFDNVQLVPFIGASVSPEALVEVAHSRFESSDPKLRVITYARNQGRLLVHDNLFLLTGATSAGSAYRLYLQSDGLGEFVDNEIWVDAREHHGGKRDLKFLLQGLRRVEGNLWRTDLTAPGAAFGVSVDGTPVVRHRGRGAEAAFKLEPASGSAASQAR